MRDVAKIIKDLKECRPVFEIMSSGHPTQEELAEQYDHYMDGGALVDSIKNIAENPTISVPKSLVEEIVDVLIDLIPIEPIEYNEYTSFTETNPIVFHHECFVCGMGLMRHWVVCPVCGTRIKWKKEKKKTGVEKENGNE